MRQKIKIYFAITHQTFYRIKIDKGLDKQYELFMMAETPRIFCTLWLCKRKPR
jgi:hypothetical protein